MPFEESAKASRRPGPKDGEGFGDCNSSDIASSTFASG
jgi:hypothetical protein